MTRKRKKDITIKPSLMAKATYDYIIDELKPPVLSRASFNLLLVIARQTVGWKDFNYSDSTKLRDWLSMKQLRDRTGYGRTTLSKSLEELSIKGYIHITIDDSHYDIGGTSYLYTLETPQMRKAYGNRYRERAKFHYSLTPKITDEVIARLEKSLADN